MPSNNPKQDTVSIKWQYHLIYDFIQIHQFFQDIKPKPFFVSNQEHNSVENWQKMLSNNSKQDIVNVIWHMKFQPNPLIHSHDTERKPFFFCGKLG